MSKLDKEYLPEHTLCLKVFASSSVSDRLILGLEKIEPQAPARPQVASFGNAILQVRPRWLH